MLAQIIAIGTAARRWLGRLTDALNQGRKRGWWSIRDGWRDWIGR